MLAKRLAFSTTRFNFQFNEIFSACALQQSLCENLVNGAVYFKHELLRIFCVQTRHFMTKVEIYVVSQVIIQLGLALRCKASHNDPVETPKKHNKKPIKALPTALFLRQ